MPLSLDLLPASQFKNSHDLRVHQEVDSCCGDQFLIGGKPSVNSCLLPFNCAGECQLVICPRNGQAPLLLVAASTLVQLSVLLRSSRLSTSNIHVSAPSGPQTSKKSSHPSAASKSKEVRSSQRVTRGSSGTSKPTSASKSKDVISNTPVPPATKDVAPASTDVPPATDDVPPATKDLPANSTLNISDQRFSGRSINQCAFCLASIWEGVAEFDLARKNQRMLKNKDKDVVDEGVDELEELSDKEEAPKKRRW
ncbi:hypothetical protein PGT21_000194 [Puccinia graminis f. sp. tritici]|uniref:Uncharacterized protein n=1 Tax=Puccinia graminis f. sp. tritici TaxID=56615 RepID=A0A5B0M9T8_PUCGR|nr:hypothetical protein PGT21_000194 [Puccinia graminis f. sp. tritici]